MAGACPSLASSVLRRLRVQCVHALIPSSSSSSSSLPLVQGPLDVDVHMQLGTRTYSSSKRCRSPSLNLNLASLADQIAFVCTNFPFQNGNEVANAVANVCASASASADLHLPKAYVRVRYNGENFQHQLSFPEAVPSFVNDVNEWGNVDVLMETSLAGIYKLNVLSSASIPSHRHLHMREAEMVLSPSIECQQVAVPVGRTHVWPKGHVHTYTNTATCTGHVLCIDVPKFDPDDEVIVSSSDVDSHSNSSLPEPSTHSWTKPALKNRDTEFEFDVSFEGQRVVFRVGDDASCTAADAVLILAFDDDGRVLMCRHRLRGWEIPGGKVDDGETAEGAAVRELLEESGASLQTASISRLGYYRIQERNQPDHIKAVFCGRVQSRQALTSEYETSEVRAIHPRDIDVDAIWNEHHASSAQYSVLLKDNVFPIALQLAQTVLSRK